MIYTAIKILAVNMHRSNVATHSLLQTSNADILLIQEPWYGHVQVAWSDSDPSGDMVNGIAHNPRWESFLPPHSSSDTCKVSAYVRTGLARLATVVNNLTHPLASASSMVLDFHHDEEQIRLVNVYHSRPERGHALHHILSSTLDLLIPTAVFGDFNTHSPLWSVPNATPSAWASRLVDWFMDQGLDLLNEPGRVTWNGCDDQLASVLDLAFLNEAAMASDQFSLYSVSFAESVGSDHAASLLTWHPETSLALVPPPAPVGFVIDDLVKDAWIKKFHLEPCPDINSIPALDDVAEKLHHDINATSTSLFPPRKAPDPRGVRWWSTECSAASSLVRQALPGRERTRANKELQLAIKNAKRQWAHDFLDHATTNNLWASVAAAQADVFQKNSDNKLNKIDTNMKIKR